VKRSFLTTKKFSCDIKKACEREWGEALGRGERDLSDFSAATKTPDGERDSSKIQILAGFEPVLSS
jgi:hypothetical protein